MKFQLVAEVRGEERKPESMPEHEKTLKYEEES
jgi:hypothetical protein